MTPWQVDRGKVQELKDRWAAGLTKKTVKEQTDQQVEERDGRPSDHWEDRQIDLMVKQRGRPMDRLTDRRTANLT